MQLFGPDKNKLGLLKNYKDYCIESLLSTGDKTLSILHPAHLSKNIVEEGYIQNKTDEYVIKEIVTQGNWKRVKAKLNVEDLEGKVFESFETVAETITDCINLALAGTGWVVGSCDVTKRRTVRKTNSSSWDIIQEAKKVYRCELEFDTLKKKINIYEKRGADKGVYFIDTLNLKNLDVQSDSYDYYTRIIAKGKGDLKVTLENFQYSNKVKTYIWKDERYTDIDSLTEDARAKLNDLSKPYRSYKATIIDLANISKENYKNILSYSLGDIITLVSKENKIREKQRIVKIVEYPDEPHRNTCEMANTILTFEDIQKELQETSNTVNNITTDNGTIDGSSINSITTKQISDFEASIGEITDLTVVNARIDELYAKKANVGELNAVVANVAELYATKATITELNALSANINTALIGKADITELNAINATIKVLEVDTAAIKTLVNGNLSSENIQAGGITSDKLTIANGFITNAMIASLDVSKINAGTISTNKFRIVSDNGGITIVGPTMQFKDKNNKVRIQMGQDTQGNFNFILRGADGTTTLIDHTGIKEKAIADNLIKENMVAADAIGEKQINYSSLITGLNKDTNTQLIKASKVAIDFTGQSLEVAFNSLKSNVDNTEMVGRNLLKNSNPKDNTYWREASGGTGTRSIINISDAPLSGITKGFQFVKDSGVNNIDYSQDNVRVVKGRTYTMSCYARCISGSTKLRLQYGKNPYPRKEVIINSTDNSKWEKYTFTFKFNEDTNNLTNIYFGAGSTQGTIQVCGMLLQEGTKSGTWVSAPEDIDSSIEDVKQITESHSTTINVMQGQINTAINNTKIVKDGQTILLKDDYNRTVSKVDSINSTIGTHTTKLDQLTGNITNVDTKVNAVQRDLEGTKSTVSSHTSQISGLNSTVNTQSSSINQLKNQIALKVESTDVIEAINNVQIGGRNLFLNSDLSKTLADSRISKRGNIHTISIDKTEKYNGNNSLKIVSSSSGNASGEDILWTSILGNDAGAGGGKKLLFSFYAKATNNTNLKARLGYGTYRNQVSITTSWKRYVIDISDTSYEVNAEVIFHLTSASTVFLANAQLEEGTKVSSWTSAPEDIDSAISTVDGKVITTNNKVATIETNLNSITSRVSSTESTVSTHTTQLGSVDNRINTAKNSAINTASADATTKANNAQNKALGDAKNYTNGQISTVNKTITDKVAEIKITTDSINQKVSNTETKVNTITANFNNLQIGGRNLLRNGLLKDISFPYVGSEYNWRTASVNDGSGLTRTKVEINDCNAFTKTINGIKIVNTSSSNLSGDIAQDNVKMEHGQVYTMSAYFKLTKGDAKGALQYGTNPYPSKKFDLTNEWKRYSFTFTYNKSEFGDKLTTNIYFGIRGANFEGYICGYKLEKGTKDTDYTDAIEDIDSSISNVQTQVTTTSNKVATIETNLNSITSRVSSTESTVSTHTTQLGTVDSRINTAKNSAINTAASDATNKANNAVNSAKTYTDGQIKTVNQTITNKVAEIKTTTDSITQKVSSADSKITTINNNITSLQNRMNSAESKITDSAIINTVKSTINTAKTEAINSANSSTDNKLKNYATTSSLIQTEKNITAKFEESGGYNIVENSTGYNKVANGWANTGNNATKIKTAYATNTRLKTGYYFILNRDNETDTNANAGVSRRFKLKPNTTYTVSGMLQANAKTKGIRFMVKTSDIIEATDVENRKDHTTTYTVFNGKLSSFTKKSLSFTTGANVKSGVIYLEHLGYDSTDTGTTTNRVYWSEIMLSEGDIEQQWTPHPNEVYSGSTVIDATGVTVNNGALRVKNNAGTTVLEGDSSGNLIISGTMKSQNGDMYVALDAGGVTFQDWHRKEQMLSVGISYFDSNRDMNGVTFAMPQYGDFIRFAHIAKPDLTSGWSSSDTQNIFMDIWSGTHTFGGKTYEKGIHAYAPLYIYEDIKLKHTGNANYPNRIASASWNSINGLLGIYGDNGAILGYQNGSNIAARIVVSEGAHPGTGDNIKSWGNWNCSGSTVHNATFSGRFVNSYANTITRSSSQTHCIEAESKQIRINFKDVQIKNGKTILNIPNRYVGMNNGYIISSIVKKGQGDVWISEEQETRFILEGTKDIKINVEIIILLNDDASYNFKTINESQLCIDASTKEIIN